MAAICGLAFYAPENPERSRNKLFANCQKWLLQIATLDAIHVLPIVAKTAVTSAVAKQPQSFIPEWFETAWVA